MRKWIKAFEPTFTENILHFARFEQLFGMWVCIYQTDPREVYYVPALLNRTYVLKIHFRHTIPTHNLKSVAILELRSTISHVAVCHLCAY